MAIGIIEGVKPEFRALYFIGHILTSCKKEEEEEIIICFFMKFSEFEEWMLCTFCEDCKSGTSLDANTPPPAANPRSEHNTNTGSFELWAF